ncbi:MAG: DNA-3-methyladenine glycosylase 2 family protein [Clostridiales Family XIII bacterium]|jgi:N-glycosylase/DNA lyase|nr:DNA-3-methyladenine glycosylase 2 family protein [Clostridiales Family XIII bacterium]
MSKDTRIVFRNVKDFSAEQTFACGQAFRWKRGGDGSYTGVAGGRAANIAFTPADADAEGCAGDIVIRPLGVAPPAACGEGNGSDSNDRNFWENYLDLRRDYGEIKRALAANDAVMARAVACGAGIRILNQEPWEALISFILSQNNHIPRITACVERLCAACGTRIDGADGGVFFAFPRIETLAGLSEGDLAPCGLGYRAKYLIQTARRVAEAGGAAWLAALRDAAIAEAESALLSLCGVGPKVAACVLLFGLGHTEGFPVDVWMARAMRELYGVDGKDAAAHAAERFGPYAGIAQQYLFHYMRNGRRPGE